MASSISSHSNNGFNHQTVPPEDDRRTDNNRGSASTSVSTAAVTEQLTSQPTNMSPVQLGATIKVAKESHFLGNLYKETPTNEDPNSLLGGLIRILDNYLVKTKDTISLLYTDLINPSINSTMANKNFMGRLQSIKDSNQAILESVGGADLLTHLFNLLAEAQSYGTKISKTEEAIGIHEELTKLFKKLTIPAPANNISGGGGGEDDSTADATPPPVNQENQLPDAVWDLFNTTCNVLWQENPYANNNQFVHNAQSFSQTNPLEAMLPFMHLAVKNSRWGKNALIYWGKQAEKGAHEQPLPPKADLSLTERKNHQRLNSFETARLKLDGAFSKFTRQQISKKTKAVEDNNTQEAPSILQSFYNKTEPWELKESEGIKDIDKKTQLAEYQKTAFQIAFATPPKNRTEQWLSVLTESNKLAAHSSQKQINLTDINPILKNLNNELLSLIQNTPELASHITESNVITDADAKRYQTYVDKLPKIGKKSSLIETLSKWAESIGLRTFRFTKAHAKLRVYLAQVNSNLQDGSPLKTALAKLGPINGTNPIFAFANGIPAPKLSERKGFLTYLGKFIGKSFFMFAPFVATFCFGLAVAPAASILTFVVLGTIFLFRHILVEIFKKINDPKAPLEHALSASITVGCFFANAIKDSVYAAKPLWLHKKYTSPLDLSISAGARLEQEEAAALITVLANAPLHPGIVKIDMELQNRLLKYTRDLIENYPKLEIGTTNAYVKHVKNENSTSYETQANQLKSAEESEGRETAAPCATRANRLKSAEEFLRHFVSGNITLNTSLFRQKNELNSLAKQLRLQSLVAHGLVRIEEEKARQEPEESSNQNSISSSGSAHTRQPDDQSVASDVASDDDSTNPNTPNILLASQESTKQPSSQNPLVVEFTRSKKQEDLQNPKEQHNPNSTSSSSSSDNNQQIIQPVEPLKGLEIFKVTGNRIGSTTPPQQMSGPQAHQAEATKDVHSKQSDTTQHPRTQGNP